MIKWREIRLQIYLIKMVCTLRKIKQELEHSGRRAIVCKDLMLASANKDGMYDYEGHFVDDMSGQNSEDENGHSSHKIGDGYLLCTQGIRQEANSRVLASYSADELI